MQGLQRAFREIVLCPLEPGRAPEGDCGAEGRPKFFLGWAPGRVSREPFLTSLLHSRLDNHSWGWNPSSPAVSDRRCSICGHIDAGKNRSQFADMDAAAVKEEAVAGVVATIGGPGLMFYRAIQEMLPFSGPPVLALVG